MMVYETGSDHAAIGVNRSGSGFVEPADSHDLSVGHRDVGAKFRGARTVYHTPILD